MDKRWIYIIIILIIGLSTLYYIVSSSNTVGSASVDVSSFIITLPGDFHIDMTDDAGATIIDRTTDEKLIITDLGKGKSIDNLTRDDLKKSKKMKSVKIENETVSLNNITIKTVFVIDDDTINSTSYFMKFNHTFSIDAYNFNDKDTLYDNIDFIIDSLKRDYKQTQD